MDTRFIAIGALFLVIATIVMPLYAYTTTMSTLTIDTTPPDIRYINPSGTSSNPTPMTAESYIECSATAWDVTGISTVYVQIYRGGVRINFLTLVWADSTIIDGKNYATYAKEWNTPAGSGETYEFKYAVEDNAGNVAIETGYGATGMPDGYFKINGVSVSIDTHLYLNTRNIAFAFIATNLCTEITGVTVEIYEGASLIKQVGFTKVSSTEWTASYTFTKDGQFEINGYIDWAGPVLRKMSLVVDTGSSGWIVPYFTIAQGLFGISGVGLIILGVVRNKGR